MNDGPLTPDSAPLNGWKDIASYLGRSVRAVQRWERELGLPIHRIRTASGQTVYAFRHEIDAWRRDVDARGDVSRDAQTPEPASGADHAADLDVVPHMPAPRRPAQTPGRHWRPWFALTWMGVGIVLTVALGVALPNERFRPRAGPPVSYRWPGSSVEALDGNGHVMWRYDFGGPAHLARWAAPAVGDLDGNGQVEIYLPVEFAAPGVERTTGATRSDAVFAFTASGQLQWTKSTDMTVSCGGTEFTGPWEIKTVLASPSQHRLWIAFTHRTWRPSFVLEVMPDRQATVRYFQPGWIMSLADWSTPSGRYLVAGGVLNERARASVVLINDSVPTAKAPADAPDFDCGTGSVAGVSRVYLLPRLETTRPPDTYELVHDLFVVGPDLKVSYGDGMANARLTPDLTMRDFAVTDVFFAKHRALETEGRLDHPATDCPFATAPEAIPTWLPTKGWTTLTVPALPNPTARPH